MALFIALAAGFASGMIGALGLGGGGVLIMFLTVFGGVSQLKAQGINLLFFIPVGIFALIFHFKNRLVDFKSALPSIIAGLAGALLGSILAEFIGAMATRRIFGIMLLFLGAFEMFFSDKKPKKNKPV